MDWDIIDDGRSGAIVQHRDGLFRKAHSGAADEAARLTWARKAGLPVPTVLSQGKGHFTMSALSGKSAAESWPQERRLQVLQAVGRFLANLHAVDASDFPFGEKGESEAKVLVHGDYCLPNIFLDPERLEVTGVIDLGGLAVADRHVDLAAAKLSVERWNPQFDEYGIQPVFDAYGNERIDSSLLAHYESVYGT